MAKDSEGEYARILRRIIDDPEYGRLPAPARLVWLTLLISREFRVIGIAPLDAAVLQRRTGLAAKVCADAMELLEDVDVIRHDGVWIWIRNHLRFQENAEVWARSESTMRGLSRRLNELPSGLSFMPEFIELYLNRGFKFDLAPRLTNRTPPTPRIPPVQGGNPEPETPETPETHEPETPETPEPEAADAAAVLDRPPRVVVFDHWREVMRKPRAKLDTKRTKAIEGRLSDGYSVEDLCWAIDGCAASTWHQGQNDRAKKFNDIELICRDASHVDQFLEVVQDRGLRPMSPLSEHNRRALGLQQPGAPALALPAGEDESPI